MKLLPAAPSHRAFFAGLACLFHTLIVSPTASAATWDSVQIGGGGYVPAVVFSEASANVIYTRTDIGGAYRWNQSTSTWIPLMDWVGFDDWHLWGCASIAADPLNANKVAVAAGMYTNAWDSSNGAILTSSNQGATWTINPLPFKVGGNMPGRNMGERLQYDPNNDNILFYAASDGNGLWKSTNGGTTWAKVTSFPNVGNYAQDPASTGDYLNHPPGVVWVTFDKRTGTSGTATQTIYVGVADLQNSLYVTTNGGTTWTRVAGQPTGFMANHGVLDTTNGILYLPYSNNAGPYDGSSGDVWKYATATGVWTKISPVPSTDTSNNYFGYGGLAIDRQVPTTIMVSALNSYWPDTMIWRSTDSGATWSRIWDFSSYPTMSYRAILDVSSCAWLKTPGTFTAPDANPKFGWMVGDIQIDPFNSNRMFYGTGATLYGSTNLTNWVPSGTGQCTITPMVKGIEETAALELISPPSGSPLLSALGDIGGFNHTSLTTFPASRFQILYNTNRSIDFSEQTPSNIIRTGSAASVNGDSGKAIALSSDGGATWYAPNSEPSGVTGGGQAAVSSANNQNIVWSPEGTGVYFTTSGGNSWTASAGIPAGASVRSDRVTAGKFYGFLNGTFYVSSDSGATFAATVTGLPTYGQFKAVFGIAGDIWLAGQNAADTSGNVTGGLYHSTNSGASFTQVTTVAVPYNIGFGKAATGQTYPAIFITGKVGTTYGIFQSDTAGASWFEISDSAHKYSKPLCITGDPRTYGRCYVGTNGRGIVYSTAGTPTADYTLSASPTAVTVNRSATTTTTVTVNKLNGFSAGVTLSASGLPTGVTATFGTNPATATSVVTFTANSTATLGAATVTITGVSGSLTRTTTVGLTVNAPATADFTLSASPTSLTVNQSASGTSTVTVNKLNGFSASVTLSASGLPSGVTATFGTNPTTATSVVTFTASSTAATGTSTVTITGVSGSLTRTTTVSLTVNATATADFTLSASPTSVTVIRSATATSTVTVNKLNGFNSNVTLSASGLPSGVTATFGTNPTTATSVVTFTASSTATLGASTVTLTGVSGSLTRTTNITLTVNAPATADFTLSASPNSLTVNQSASGTSTVTVNKLNGFSASVTLSASGLPSGVTATFGTNPTTATSVVTFTASSTAATGTSTVTLTGVSGSLTRTTTVSLTVAAAATTVVVQSETGTWDSAGVFIETTNAGWTGTGYVNTGNAIGAFSEVTVNVATAGSYQITFRHANGTTTNRAADLRINGTVVQTAMAFNGTGSFTTWADVSITKTLNAGNNTIRLTATTANGCSNLDRVTVAPATASAPPAPTGLSATAGNAQVSLSWSASSGATSYTVKRSTVSGGSYTNVATGVTATNYTNTGLTNGTTYYFVVSAVNATGESPNSAQVSATPAAATAIVVQSETGTWDSAGVLETTNAGWTGTGYVNTGNAVGAFSEVTVNVATAGNYQITFRHANGTTTNRAADLRINGTVVQTAMAFNGTGSFTTWADVSITKTLNAGNNTIRLTATTANGCANLDKVTVQ